MTISCSGSSTVPSLPPPRSRSPPEYPDLYGKRREMARVVMLEREIGFLEEELKSMEGIQPATRCCKEVAEFVLQNPDPLIPTYGKKRRSCRFWKWLCKSSCFTCSWICCKVQACCDCNLCTCPSLKCKVPACCDCNLCTCPSCACCSFPKWRCCCFPRSCCLKKSSCWKCRCPSCSDCCCSCISWNCWYPRCPKLNKCSNCINFFCNPRCCCFCC